jgi:hypothetical protein
MRRLASEMLALSLLVAACATYDGLGNLSPGGASGGTAGNSSGGKSASQAGSSGVGGTSGGAAGTGNGDAGAAPSAGSSSVSGGGNAAGGSAGAAAGGKGTAGMEPVGGALGEGGEPPVADACPQDPAKTAPGVCGCGFPDADTAKLAGCQGLKSALVHRYDFEGTGTAVVDRVGTAHGTVQAGGTLSKVDGKGAVVLAGGKTGAYVNLPNGLLSSLTNATLEAWVTWGGGTAWQRIFDFGDSTAAQPEDTPASGKSYLFLTPMTDTASGGFARAVFSLNGGAAAAETRVDGTAALPQTLSQVVVVVDTAAELLSLFVDGQSVGDKAFTGSLSGINDVNSWLGRSQYDADPELGGTLHDFRIYGAALSPLQIATSFAGGPDPAFLSQ